MILTIEIRFRNMFDAEVIFVVFLCLYLRLFFAIVCSKIISKKIFLVCKWMICVNFEYLVHLIIKIGVIFGGIINIVIFVISPNNTFVLQSINIYFRQ